MSILPIYNCFHTVLKQKSKAVEAFDDELKDFIDDMYQSMYNAAGIGLAANQIGDNRSIFIVDTTPSEDEGKSRGPITLINPEIISHSDDTVEFQEGCLSVPKYFEDVSRVEAIEVKYWDIDMKEHIIEADSILARVILHEYDHLNGILFYERLTPIRRTLAKSKLKKIKRGDYDISYPMIMPDGSKMNF
jgi:peptide deformylase